MNTCHHPIEAGYRQHGGAVPPAGCVLDDAEALTTTPPVRVAAVHRSGLQLAGDGDNETEPRLSFATG
jgi:hypothetical protein